MKKDGKQSLRRIISNNLFLIKIALKEAPVHTLQQLTEPLKTEIIVFFEHIYMIGFIINAITQQRPFTDVLLYIGTIFTVVTLNLIIFNHIIQYVGPISRQKIERKINLALYEKAANMDLKCYDDPEFYNSFVWAMSEAPKRVHSAISSVANLLGAIVGIIVAGGYILTQDWIGVVVILVSFSGIMLTSGIRNRLRLSMNEEKKPLERRRDYTSRVLYLADYAKEVRLSNVHGKLFEDFESASDGMKEVIKKRSWKLVIMGFFPRGLFEIFLIDGLYLLHLLYQSVALKLIPFGTMVILYNACSRARGRLFQISKSLPELQEHSLYIEKIREFLSYENTVVSPDKPEPLPTVMDSLELRNVSFAYGSKDVIRGVNMTIKRGEKIAIVGYNGAGKTTLVKLLMRLYDVSEGKIIYNGCDIREYEVDEYRNVFETVFQDYQLFAASVAENITAGTETVDYTRADSAVSRAGFTEKLRSLKDGYDTQITNEFDDNGVLLSGGEAQSLVIARAFYKDSPVIILDEPSSALDPLAEYNLNRTMFELGEDKTVITISHRLSTTKSADRIYMFENGQIAEQGTHDELMEMDGKYAEMFSLQAEKYRGVKL